MHTLQQLDRLIYDLQVLPYADAARLADIQRRAEALIRTACGDASPILAEWWAPRFRPYSLRATQEYERGLWELSREWALKLLEQVRVCIK